MEKIRTFVENMFLGLPDTQPVRDAEAHLIEGMTDRYEALLAQGKDPDAAFGIAVAEFGSMEELRRELGDSSTASASPAAPAETASLALSFRDEDTLREYRAFRKKFPVAIAIGVALCILGAALLPMLTNVQGFPEEVALMNMFSLIAIAVGLFVYFGLKNRRFNRELFDEEKGRSADKDDDPLSRAIMLGATCLYLFLGFAKGLWHPGWIVFPAGAVVCLLVNIFWPHRQR